MPSSPATISPPAPVSVDRAATCAYGVPVNFRKLLIWIPVWGAVFVAGVLLFNFVLMPMLVHQRGAVIVPDLRMVSETEAQREVSGLGLNLRVDRSDYNAEVPQGYVISQSPRPSETIKEGRSVMVVLSLGARTQLVPELKGMSLRQSRAVLSRSNLRVGRVARVLAGGEPREQVLASNPPVGEELPEGDVVDLVVAVGGQKARYAMPDLTGQDLLFIREKLRDLGFRVGGVRYETREGVFPNTVVGQTPPPGAMIREGDSIELVAASSE
jgi:serine/threonine-protein kinase